MAPHRAKRDLHASLEHPRELHPPDLLLSLTSLLKHTTQAYASQPQAPGVTELRCYCWATRVPWGQINGRENAELAYLSASKVRLNSTQSEEHMQDSTTRAGARDHRVTLWGESILLPDCLEPELLCGRRQASTAGLEGTMETPLQRLLTGKWL